MVKVKNVHGDRYKGRQEVAVYQGRYGKQIRRKYTEKRKERSEMQKETSKRFREGIRFAKSLNSTEIETLKQRINELGLKTSWYNFAKKAVMQRAKIELEVTTDPEFYWNLKIYHPLLTKIEIYDIDNNLVYGEDGITDLEKGYIKDIKKLRGTQNIKRILIYSYASKIYEEIVTVEDMTVYMRKDVYDVNENNIVDNSEKLEGKTLDEITNDILAETTMKTQCKMRAYLSADQLDIPSGTWTKVLLDAETYDVGSDFDIENHKFIAPQNGYYLLIGSIQWKGSSVVADKRYYVGFKKNNTTFITLGNFHAADANTLTPAISDIVYLAQNDYIELYGFHAAGVDTVDIGGYENGTFLCAHLLSV